MLVADEKMYYRTRTGAKMALLSEINRTLDNAPSLSKEDKDSLQLWADDIKISIENHDRDMTNVTEQYQRLSSTLKETMNSKIIDQVKNGAYDTLSTEDLWDDSLIRASESILPAMLLQQPTKKMTETTQSISKKMAMNIRAYVDNNFNYFGVQKQMNPDFMIKLSDIEKEGISKFEVIQLLDKGGKGEIKNGVLSNDQAEFIFTNHEKLQKTYPKIKAAFNQFALSLIHEAGDRVYAGGFPLKEINNLLPAGAPKINQYTRKLTDEQTLIIINHALNKLDKPDNLMQEMYLHFSFSRSLMRAVPVFERPETMPTDQLKFQLEKKYGPNGSEKFNHIIQLPTKSGFDARCLVSNELMYDTDYYKVESEKGRRGPIRKYNVTAQLGTLSSRNLDKYEDSDELDEIFPTPQQDYDWTPDCVSQAANTTDSIVVKDLLQHEASYVSGPSGTTSLDLGLMEMLGNFSTVEEKQIYLQSVLAYVVGSGLHSTHEVLGPATYCLDLIPGYQASVTNVSLDSKPPNFNQFFEIAAKNDPEFNLSRENAWKKLLQFHDMIYLPNLEPDVAYELLQQAILDFDQTTDDSKKLITKFAELNLLDVNASGMSAMLLACCNGSKDAVQYLERFPQFNQYSEKSKSIAKNIDTLNKISYQVKWSINKDSGCLSIEGEIIQSGYTSIDCPISESASIINDFCDLTSLEKFSGNDIKKNQYQFSLEETQNILKRMSANSTFVNSIESVQDKFKGFVAKNIADDAELIAQKPGLCRSVYRDKKTDDVIKIRLLSTNDEELLQDQTEAMNDVLGINAQLDCGRDKESGLIIAVIKMPYLGQPLSKLKDLDENKIIKIMHDTLEILQDLHSQDRIHGDINPDNIIVKLGVNGEIERVSLVDFEHSQKLDNSGLVVQSSVNNAYSPPELLQTRLASRDTDMFSLGTVIEEAIDKHLLSPSKDLEEIVDGLIEIVPENRSDCDTALEQISNLSNNNELTR